METAPAAPAVLRQPVFSRRRWIWLALATAGLLAGWVVLRQTIGIDALVAHHAALMDWRMANPNLTLAVFVLAFIAIAAISLPGIIVLKLTAGYLFGAVFGAAIAVVAATLGATILFLAVRAGLGASLLARHRARLGNGTLGVIYDTLAQNELRALFLLRLTPVVPFFVSNTLPAVAGVRLHNFIFSTFIGIIPSALIFSSMGNGLSDVIASGHLPVIGSRTFFILLIPAMVAAVMLGLQMRRHVCPP